MNGKNGNPRPAQTEKLALFPDLCELLHFVAMLKDSLEVFHEKFERNAKELFELGYLPILEEGESAKNQANAAKILVRLFDYDPLEKDKDALKDFDRVTNAAGKFDAAKKLLQGYCKGIFEFEKPSEEDAKSHVLKFVTDLLRHESFADDAQIFGFHLEEKHGVDIRQTEALEKFVLRKYSERFKETRFKNADFETLAETFDYGNEAQKLALHIAFSGLEPKAKKRLFRKVFRKAVGEEKKYTKRKDGERAVRTSKLLQKMEELWKNFGMLSERAKQLSKNEKCKETMRKHEPIPQKLAGIILKLSERLLPEGFKKRLAPCIKTWLENHKDEVERWMNPGLLKQITKIAEERGGIPLSVKNSEKTVGEILDEAKQDLNSAEKSEELDKTFEEFGRGSEKFEAALPNLMLDAEEGRDFFGLGTAMLDAIPEIRNVKIRDILGALPSDFLPTNKSEEEAEKIISKPEKFEFKNLQELLNFIHEKRNKVPPKNAFSDRKIAFLYIRRACKIQEPKFTTQNPWELIEILKFYHEFFPKKHDIPRFLFENLADFLEFIRAREAANAEPQNRARNDAELALKYLLEAHDFDEKLKMQFVPRTMRDTAELHEFFHKVDLERNASLKQGENQTAYRKLEKFVIIGHPIFIFKSLNEFAEFAKKDAQEAGEISGKAEQTSKEFAKKFLLNPYKKLCVRFAPSTKEAEREFIDFLKEATPEEAKPKSATFQNLHHFLSIVIAWKKQTRLNVGEGNLLLQAKLFLDANRIVRVEFTTKNPLEIAEYQNFFQQFKQFQGRILVKETRTATQQNSGKIPPN